MMADECLNSGWCNAVMVRLDRMEKTQDETRATLREVATALNKLAVIEERQQATSTAIERMAAEQKRIDERLRALEISEPMQAQTAEWVKNAVWAAASAAAMFAAGKLGLF
jgi:response regulator RpfG family c-di-GMP phosphodiesterase